VSERPRLAFDPIDEARRQWELHGWAAEAPAMALVTSVMRLQQIFLARADTALRPLGLTFARYEVLMILFFSRSGRLPLGKMSARLQVHAASVTNAVDRLVAQGLVVREPNPADGRGTLAALTHSGRRLAGRATEVMNESVFSDLGVEGATLRGLSVGLAGLRKAAGDFE
jgi:DNA-binding MarR family transcriptional regulator